MGHECTMSVPKITFLTDKLKKLCSVLHLYMSVILVQILSLFKHCKYHTLNKKYLLCELTGIIKTAVNNVTQARMRSRLLCG